MLTWRDKDAYWRVVEATLVEIFGVEVGEAYQKTQTVRARIESRNGEFPDLIYHREAFDVAQDMADKQIDFLKVHKHYEQIVARYQNPEVTAEGQ